MQSSRRSSTNFRLKIEAIDSHLKRLKLVEGTAAREAKPVEGYTPEGASESRGGVSVQVKTQPKLEPGIEFARLVKSLGAAKGDMGRAAKIALIVMVTSSNAYGVLKQLDERGEDRLEFAGYEAMQKANVSAGSAVSGNWAADLVLTEGGAFADFAQYLRPATIVGKFGTGSIPGVALDPLRHCVGNQQCSRKRLLGW
jgi:hypothetical protein